MSNARPSIVATAGHVDHGKSALVRALTGIDPDRLPEEKARGITIDLGFASLELDAPSGDRLQVGIVDVPGHEDFVKNMAAGVGAADLALLVVAADDGWMPQTEEHLQVLTYFGVRRAVVALTKVDLVTDIDRAVAGVRQRLRGTPFEGAAIVPTSIVSGYGLDQLVHELAQRLADVPGATDISKPRLPIDRVFTLPGIGTVVTGTLLGGHLRRGQPVVIQPSGHTARIRRLQSHRHELETSGPGRRIAVNLPDVTPEEVHRGDVLTLDGLGDPHARFDLLLEVSARATRMVRSGGRVHVHHGSGHVPATLVLLDRREAGPGERTLAQARLDHPVFVFEGDRLIIRDWAAQATLAGGLVIDLGAGPRQGHKPAWLRHLRCRAEAPADAAEWVSSIIERDRFVVRSRLLVQSTFGAPQVEAAVQRLIADGQVTAVGDRLVAADSWRRLRQDALEAVDAFHRAHPDSPGLPLTDLRTRLGAIVTGADAFEALLAALADGGCARDGAVVRRLEHRQALPAELEATGAALRSALTAKPLDPPSRSVLAPDPQSRRALRFLIERGEAIDISPDLVLAAAAVGAARDAVVEVIGASGAATLADVRSRLGCTRRVLVPLLEYFDRSGVTVRQGDYRRLPSSVR